MKAISSAIFYMSEWQAIFQCEEYSFCEARPYQDKQFIHGVLQVRSDGDFFDPVDAIRLDCD